MIKRILIMGMPGTGKTTLAKELYELLISVHKTALLLTEHDLRIILDGIDNTNAGRVALSEAMRDLANESSLEYAICDFEASLVEERQQFNADYTIWVNTLDEEIYQEVSQGFVPPTKYNFCVTTKDAKKWSREIFKHLLFLENNQ